MKHGISSATVAFLLLAGCLTCPDGMSAYEFPLSEASIRSAYFLGKKQAEMGSAFLQNYTRNIPQFSVGSCVSQASIQTPYAQVAIYSSERPDYSAQQAIKDFSNKDLPILVHLSICYRVDALENALNVTVVQNEKKIQPLAQSTEPYFPPSDEYERLPCIGEEIDMQLPAKKVDASNLKIEIGAPDGRTAEVVFDLSTLF